LTGSDLVAVGLVASLNRPGGNATGLTSIAAGLAAKRLEMLRELVPAITSFALLVNPTNPVLANAEIAEVQMAAGVLGVRLSILNASSQN
jgi:putative ABC transport system substrate-binding protein